jgi:hypothetical protein
MSSVFRKADEVTSVKSERTGLTATYSVFAQTQPMTTRCDVRPLSRV